MAQLVAYATGVLPNIYAFHRYTGNSTSLYHTPVRQYPVHSRVEPRSLTPDLTNRLRTLYAQ